MSEAAEMLIKVYGPLAFMAMAFLVAIIYLFKYLQTERKDNREQIDGLVERLVSESNQSAEQYRKLSERVLVVLESLSNKLDRRAER